MTVSAFTSPDLVEYFDTVRRRMLDIPWSQRQDLLADLLVRLNELPYGATPREVLGAAEDYARLTREAAGYGPRAPRRFAYIRAWSRRRKLLAIAALVVVFVVAPASSAAATWFLHYQPLRAESFGGWSSADFVKTDLPTNVDYRRYEPGAQYVVNVQLHNTGRRTVTVTGVSVPSDYLPIVPTGLRTTRSEHDMAMWERGTAVDRVSVHPGETVYLFVMMKMTKQQILRGDSESENLPVLHVEVMGVHHTLPIEGSPIGVVAR